MSKERPPSTPTSDEDVESEARMEGLERWLSERAPETAAAGPPAPHPAMLTLKELRGFVERLHGRTSKRRKEIEKQHVERNVPRSAYSQDYHRADGVVRALGVVLDEIIARQKKLEKLETTP